jgi:hypothetical protein
MKNRKVFYYKNCLIQTNVAGMCKLLFFIQWQKHSEIYNRVNIIIMIQNC